eukprot:CAMPEP_0196706906 /NCGR_PEP_ID=MMETSP1090-20130531/62913_1 /TAXON_ID=37098 /ORGANISM="Isochrysis sp, Strain CCMP1244" /LENGTH=42 /DNA_ID= /DNA_START= /DNA_END= /DNA_ORIENTATION=
MHIPEPGWAKRHALEASPAAIDDLEPSIFAKVPAFAAAGSGG